MKILGHLLHLVSILNLPFKTPVPKETLSSMMVSYQECFPTSQNFDSLINTTNTTILFDFLSPEGWRSGTSEVPAQMDAVLLDKESAS